MSDFERYEAMMLDHVYGLLEPEQVVELDAFLTTPEGESLRQRAEDWKRQLSLATKSEFPNVQFAPPPTAVAVRQPASQPASTQAAQVARKHARPSAAKSFASNSWAPWAIAVSIAAVVMGFGIPLLRQAVGQMDEAKQLQVRQAELATADKKHSAFVAAYNAEIETAARDERAAEERSVEIDAQFKRDRDEARKTIEDKQFIVRLSGPERAQPGAPNEWRVDMFRKQNGAKQNDTMSMPGRVEWVVKDQAGQVLFSDAKQAAGKEGFREPATIGLPVSFWENVKPNSDLTLEVVAYEDNLKSKVSSRIPLARPVYVTHLATDKPLYQPGESVYFRSLTLDRATLTPPDKDMALEFRITKPGGQPEPIVVDGDPLRRSARVFTDAAHAGKDLLGPDKKPLRGIGCGAFDLPEDAAGGEYMLSVVDVTPGVDEVLKRVVAKEQVLETRKFNVIKYQKENILKTLEFDGKSYGRGDVVMVKCTAAPIQGGKKKLLVERVVVNVDGQNVAVNAPKFTDPDGTLRLKFTLPQNITQGIGTINVAFNDGAEPEVISRPIPLIGRILHVEFFPEGGDLIENVPNRVYFQATTPTGKPADLKGFITDGYERMTEVATLTNADHPGVNRGQGSFTFTPRPGKTYFLKLQKPSGILEPTIKSFLSPSDVARGIGLGSSALGVGALASSIPTGFELPKAKADGVVLTALDQVTHPDQPIRVLLQTAKAKKTLVVGAYARGNLVDHQRIEVEAGKPYELSLKPSGDAGGVTRLTVFEEKTGGDANAVVLVPVAERLVYRKPAQQLLLNVHPDQSRYNPGSQVGLDVLAMNEDEKPVPAILMVAVVNQSVLTMADEKTGRLMPTHFLLASEVKKPEDLEHADFLLGDNPKAAEALDLLLGTQGWRRFAEQSAVTKPKPDADVDRLLVANGQRSQAPVDTFRQEVQKVYNEYLPRREAADARLAEAQLAHAAVKQKYITVRQETKQLADERSLALERYQESQGRLREFEDEGASRRTALLARLCIGLLVISGCCIGLGVIRRQSAGIGYFATAAGCFALCAVALLGSSIAAHDGDAGKEVVFRDVKATAADRKTALALPQGFADDMAVLTDEGRMMDEKAEMAGAKENFFKQDRFGGVGGGAGAMRAKGAADPNGGDKPTAAPAPDPMMRKTMMARPAVVRGGAGGFPAGATLTVAGAMAPPAEQAKLAEQRDKAKDLKKALRDADGKEKAEGVANFRKRARELQLANGRLDQLQPRLEQQLGDARGLGAKRQNGFGLATQPDFDIAEMDVELQLIQANQAPGFYVREFKFQKESNPTAERNDFTETVCWQPVLVLPDSGRADVQFQLSDSIARYQVLVAGHTLDGRIGAFVTHIEARKPFTVDPKVPFEITAGDRVDIPIRVVNDSDVRRVVSFDITPNGLSPADPTAKLAQGNLRDQLELAANEKGRKIVKFRAAKREGDVSIMVIGASDPIETPDQILRTFRVVPDGFPASGAFSDLLEKKANATFTLPESVKGSLKVQVHVYPTTLADLQKGLESLMREPGGCFEQTSTSNYPNLLVLDYLKASDKAQPELTQRAKEMLDRGYAKLVAFECPDSSDKNNRHGFEWFGQLDQQHQALTAYGLLQFKDLDKAYPGKVDPELIKRTQQYLLSQQNPNKEGFKRNSRAIDSFGRAPDYITNAYIVWALTESDPDDKEGMTDLIKQLDFLKKQAKELAEAKNDPYFLALVANALLHRPINGNREAAVAILEQIAEQNLKNGLVEGAKTSITCSGGRDLQIETTALTVLGWLRSGEPTKFIKPVKEATKWIGQQRGGYGGFGSTQSTILALKALIEHTKASRKPAEAGEIRLTVNGKSFVKAFTKDDQEVITLDIPNPEEVFKQGPNEALVEITAKQAYPFSLAWSCSTTTPLSSEKRSVDLATKLAKNNVIEGEMVRLDLTLTNKVKEGHGMAVAVVGLPGGCRLPADLKELTKLREDGKISYFEIRGRELILYWRSLKPEEQIDLSVNLICEIPGVYTGPASRGYLYYNADHKHWVKPLSVTIAPANQPGDEEVASR